MSRFIEYLVLAVFSVGLMIGRGGALHAAPVNCVSGTTPNPNGVLSVVVSQSILLGKFPPPDTGTGTVTVGANGTRTIPATLNINDPSKEVFQSATVQITGGIDCRFRITITGLTSANLSNVRLLPGAAYAANTLSSTVSGAQGVLDGAGNFVVRLGISAQVTPASSGIIAEALDITVRYY